MVGEGGMRGGGRGGMRGGAWEGWDERWWEGRDKWCMWEGGMRGRRDGRDSEGRE